MSSLSPEALNDLFTLYATILNLEIMCRLQDFIRVLCTQKYILQEKEKIVLAQLTMDFTKRHVPLKMEVIIISDRHIHLTLSLPSNDDYYLELAFSKKHVRRDELYTTVRRHTKYLSVEFYRGVTIPFFEPN